MEPLEIPTGHIAVYKKLQAENEKLKTALDCELNIRGELKDEIVKLKEQALLPCVTCDVYNENDRLKAELEQYRWIPLSERLPEEHKKYRVSDGGRIWDHLYMPSHNCWQKDGLLHYERIIYWQEIILPK